MVMTTMKKNRSAMVAPKTTNSAIPLIMSRIVILVGSRKFDYPEGGGIIPSYPEADASDQQG